MMEPSRLTLSLISIFLLAECAGGQQECTLVNGECKPKLANCGTPNVTYGTVEFESTCSGCTSNITCFPGHYPEPEVITCNKISGTVYEWTTASCIIKDCGMLPTIEHGNATLVGTVTTYGAEAIVECEECYTPNNDTIQCTAAGTWSISTCVIKECESPTVDNGEVFPLDVSCGAEAKVICDAGYKGSKTITCLPSGLFDDTSLCEPEKCAATPVTNGEVVPEGAIGTSQDVDCNDGYKPTNSETHCVLTHDDMSEPVFKWLPTPTCGIVDCGMLPTIEHGNATLVGTITTYGAEAIVECEECYSPNNDTIQCTAAGTWSTSTCVIKECETPTVDNGEVLANDLSCGAEVNVICNHGYKGSKTITCLPSGLFDDTPLCEPDKCAAIPVTNGEVVPEEDIGTSQNVNCDDGYEPTNSETHCVLTYDDMDEPVIKWLPTPICGIVDCGMLPTIEHGNATLVGTVTTYGAEAIVECEECYSPNNDTIQCTAAGTWSTSTCVIKECETPNVDNGEVLANDLSCGAEVNVVCNHGYKGSKTMTCLPSGLFDDTPLCEPDKCAATPVTNGEVVPEDAIGTSQDVDCNDGYEPTNPETYCVLTHDDMGNPVFKWLPAPTCRIVDKCIGGDCDIDDECTSINATCKSGTCGCSDGEYVSTVGKCVAIPEACERIEYDLTEGYFNVTASTSGYGGLPEFALNGIKTGIHNRYSTDLCYHNKDDANAWWKVTLKKAYTIRRIVITNRIGGFGHRLKNLTAYVDDAVCDTFPGPAGRNQLTVEIKCASCGLVGQEVKILTTHTILTLCEVEIFMN